MPGETCIGPQADGSCEQVVIPSCVDRSIHCNPIPGNSTLNAEITWVSGPAESIPTLFETIFTFECTERNHYFNFSVPPDLISYYYSNNINLTTVACNHNR